MSELEGQVALVTGASRGIGKAIATRLAGSGATVVGTATTETGASAISEYLDGNGEGMCLDVTQPEAITGVVKSVTDQYGAPLILVNNAGITRDNLMMRMKDEEWDDIIATNLSAVFRCSKAVLRGMMKARQGRIINISSVVGVMGNAGQANYSAAKAGLLGLTKSMAREIGSRGITVNVVAPGMIDTDMTRELPEDVQKQMLDQIPLERLGQPEDVAAAVAFIASPSAAYITGETLHVNGGMYMA